MTNLVIAEHDNTSLKAATLNTVTAAKKLGGEIHVLVAGSGCAAVADAAAKIEGVAKVLIADAAHYADQTAENVAALIIAIAPCAPGFVHTIGLIKSVRLMWDTIYTYAWFVTFAIAFVLYAVLMVVSQNVKEEV